jgi:cysteine sulfinate desulfinase/cysteine desulfurase-like protein
MDFASKMPETEDKSTTKIETKSNQIHVNNVLTMLFRKKTKLILSKIEHALIKYHSQFVKSRFLQFFQFSLH